jgi:hypothetical protein
VGPPAADAGTDAGVGLPVTGGSPDIAGAVVDAAGRSLSGAQVELYVEPRTSEPGTSALPLVATASTDATGRFSLVAPSTREVLARLQDDGIANFVLVVRRDGLVLQRNLSRRPSSLIDDASSVDALPASDRKRRVVGAERVLRLVLAPGRAGVSPASGRTPLAPAPQCLYSVVSTGRAWTTVGEIHVGGDATGRFTYGRTADSNIDVGFSATGAGGWSISGTVHVGNSLSATVWAERGPGWGTKFKTQFEYEKRKYGGACQGHKIVGTRWVGGTDTNEPVYGTGVCDQYPQYSVPYGKNSGFHRDANRAHRWGTALTVFGVTLGARSGYSTSVAYRYSTGSQLGQHWVCGNNDSPLYAARIFAGL